MAAAGLKVGGALPARADAPSDPQTIFAAARAAWAFTAYLRGLTPLRKPGTFRLREMWIDARTFVTQTIIIAANFSRKPYVNVPWLLTFKY